MDLHAQYSSYPTNQLKMMAKAPRVSQEKKDVINQILAERAAGTAEAPKPTSKKSEAAPKPAAKKAAVKKEAPTKKVAAKKEAPVKKVAAKKTAVKKVRKESEDVRGSLLKITDMKQKPKEVALLGFSLGDTVVDPKNTFKGTINSFSYYTNKPNLVYATVESSKGIKKLITIKRLQKQ